MSFEPIKLEDDERLIAYKDKGFDKKLSLSLWAATRMAKNQLVVYTHGIAIHRLPKKALHGAQKTLERYSISYLLPKTYKEAHNLDPNCLGLS